MSHPFSRWVGCGDPCLQGEDILLGVITYPFIQESRPLRSKLCDVYLSTLGDQRKEISMRTERAPNGFSRRGGLQPCSGRVGSFGQMKRTFPVRGTWWVETLKWE